MNKKIPLFLLCLMLHTAHGMVQEVPGAIGVKDGTTERNPDKEKQDGGPSQPSATKKTRAVVDDSGNGGDESCVIS